MSSTTPSPSPSCTTPHQAHLQAQVSMNYSAPPPMLPPMHASLSSHVSSSSPRPIATALRLHDSSVTYITIDSDSTSSSSASSCPSLSPVAEAAVMVKAVTVVSSRPSSSTMHCVPNESSKRPRESASESMQGLELELEMERTLLKKAKLHEEANKQGLEDASDMTDDDSQSCSPLILPIADKRRQRKCVQAQALSLACTQPQVSSASSSSSKVASGSVRSQSAASSNVVDIFSLSESSLNDYGFHSSFTKPIPNNWLVYTRSDFRLIAATMKWNFTGDSPLSHLAARIITKVTKDMRRFEDAAKAIAGSSSPGLRSRFIRTDSSQTVNNPRTAAIPVAASSQQPPAAQSAINQPAAIQEHPPALNDASAQFPLESNTPVGRNIQIQLLEKRLLQLKAETIAHELSMAEKAVHAGGPAQDGAHNSTSAAFDQSTNRKLNKITKRC